jgi:DNA processing protein
VAPPPEGGACDRCLRRAWLLARLAGHIELHRDRLDCLLALPDGELVTALAGRRREAVEHELAGFAAPAARDMAQRAGVELVCRCRSGYPEGLRDLVAAPAVLHVTGGLDRLAALVRQPPVALVGARQASAYGAETARALGRGLAAAGVTVISGLARGIDTCVHRGALEAEGPTLAVLAGAAELAYPARAQALHARIRRTGVTLSEQPPGVRARRWMFPARNRLIAALAAMTVVVEARSGSGALITAGYAADLGRLVGAVPGRVVSPLARGPHALLRDGARLIEAPEDVLDALYGPGAGPRPGQAVPLLAPEQQRLLDALAEGADAETAVRRAGLSAEQGLATLAALELAGRLGRGPGGRYLVSL